MASIGRIQRVGLREVWKREDYDFTVWLQDNIEVLSDAIGLRLDNVEREQSAGTFSCDLTAEDDAGNTVIIENQYGKSNHDHLGKVLTYLTFFEARTAIWIVEDPRPEHTNAIAWLNQSTDASFYLVKLEAIRIEDSPPAAMFTLITGPSAEAREVGEKKRERTGTQELLFRFWDRFIALASLKLKRWTNISPKQGNWIGSSAGLPSGHRYAFVANKDHARVELYIDKAEDDGEASLEAFGKLEHNRKSIESTFGAPLEWQSMDGRRACRICSELETGGYQDESKWPEVQEAMVDAMARLEKALGPYLKA